MHGTASLYASLSQLQLKTLKSVVEKKVKTESHIIKLRADKALFARLTVLAQKSSLDLAEVMKYALRSSLRHAEARLGLA